MAKSKKTKSLQHRVSVTPQAVTCTCKWRMDTTDGVSEAVKHIKEQEEE
jgi:hypothetical protein